MSFNTPWGDNSADDQMNNLIGTLFNMRRFAPWYDDRADYNTDAKSYYDYLARSNKIFDAIADMINKINKRELHVNDTNTVSMKQNGDWRDNDMIELYSNAKLSSKNGNLLKALDDGLYINKTDDVINVNKIEPLNELITNGYIDIQAKEFILAPRLPRNAVMQNIFYDVRTGYFYVVQADVNTPRGFVVSKIDAGGYYYSQMYVKESEHGSDVFFTSDEHGINVYYRFNDNFYYLKYQDNKTFSGSDGQMMFKPPFNGIGMLSYNNDYMAHINEVSGETKNLTIYPYKKNGLNFSFNSDTHAEIDISGFINDTTSLLQGLAIIDERQVTGDNTNNILLFVYTGTPNVESTLLVYRYDIDKNIINFIRKVSGLDNVISKEVVLKTYEAEALNVINISLGDNVYSGLIYGLSAGEQGKREQYIFGLLNNNVSRFLNSARDTLNDNQNTKYVSTNEKYLYNIINPGTYEIKSNDTPNLLDFPWTWRGVPTDSDWLLENTKNNEHGDYIQRLTRRGVHSQLEIYERVIDYNAKGFGQDYKPSGIGWWSLIAGEGVKINDLYGGNADKFKKLSDFSTPNQNYYVSSNSLSKLTDLEGLEDFIKQSGFRISVYSAGGLSDMVIQQVDVIQDSKVKMAKRVIYGEPDTYGSKLIIDPSKNGQWVIYYKE